jgi:RimJ/RimL family protein N-acetyltransferase
MSVVALRPVDDTDLGALFDQMRDPGSAWMAAFSAEHPDDKTAFKVHITKQKNSPGTTLRAITRDGQLVGCIGRGSLGTRHHQPGPPNARPPDRPPRSAVTGARFRARR